MDDLEVRQLRYFVAVAEELHFGRAAERLGVAQPSLSRALGELERQLGVKLVDRTTRHVALTSAGTVLLEDARTALDAVSAAGRRVRNAGLTRPRLRLALKADHDSGLLPQILASYEREDSSLPFELVLGARGEQAPALRDGRADVALILGPFDTRRLDHEALLSEPRLAAVAAGDPLADKLSLRLADFDSRVLPDGSLAAEDRSSRPFNAVPLGPVEPAPGLAPAQRPRDLTQILNLVELGSIVSFLPLSITRRYLRPGIVYLPVQDLVPVTLAVVWPAEARSRAAAAFVRAAITVAAAAQQDVLTTLRLKDVS